MAISAGIDLRYPLGCLELSSLDLGIEGSGGFLSGDPRQAGTGRLIQGHPGQAGQFAVIRG